MNAANRQRGSKELWLDAAYALLVSDGIEAVKVMPLAKRLNLSRTGFYWFFSDIGELHAAIIQRWKNKNTDNLVARCTADAPDISTALLNLMDCWMDPLLFDAPLDLAIRNWARIDPALQQHVSRADQSRIAAVSAMFLRHGFSQEQANVRGLTLIYTQIGYISMQMPEKWDERLARVRHYVTLFAGTAPSPEAVTQFLQRHAAKSGTSVHQ